MESKKLIVVTGGSKGIGRAILEYFLERGFVGVTCARKPDELESLKKTFAERNQVLHCMRADMSIKEDVIAFGKFVLSLEKPITVLVNNAGFFVPGEITTEPEGTLESMLQTNLLSAYYFTRILSAKMKEQKEGLIINICSIASLKPYANGGSYAITKFALLGFSKCLREELKPFGIKVSSIMPGATKTASWDGVDLPDDRFMKIEDVAKVAYACFDVSGAAVLEDIVMRPLPGDI
jgi:short-subunit dehydrogenase